MNPSRKAGLLGIWIGSALLVMGVAGFGLPLLLVARATSLGLGHDRAQTLTHSVMAWLIGGPIGFTLGIFGALVLLLSLVVYVDSRRKERSNA